MTTPLSTARPAVTLADVLTPAVIRERMAVSGCYGDGVTVPAEPCDHDPAECAGASARTFTDAQLTAAAREYVAYDPGRLDELAHDVLHIARKAHPAAGMSPRRGAGGQR